MKNPSPGIPTISFAVLPALFPEVAVAEKSIQVVQVWRNTF